MGITLSIQNNSTQRKMGQFSWFSKNGEQIRNEHHRGQKVWMSYLDESDQVQTVKEEEYDGYGRFGGLDYYEVLAKMNGKTSREEGIAIAFEPQPFSPKFPQLYTVEPASDQKHFWEEECESDPNQGWVDYEDEWKEHWTLHHD